MDQLEVLRPLGAVERFLFSRSVLGLYHSVGVTAFYSNQSCSDQAALKLRILTALADVIAIQPQLALLPVGANTNSPHFVRLSKIDLNQVCTFAERALSLDTSDRDPELDALLEREHNAPLEYADPPIPFWRLVVSLSPDPTRFAASIIFNHVLFDTKSASIFHECFAAAMSKDTPILDSPMVIPPKVDILPAFYQLYTSTATDDEMHRLRESAKTPAVAADDLWSGAPQKAPMNSRITIRLFSQATSRAFARACRQQQTTVTATLEVLATAVLFTLVPAHFTSMTCQNAALCRAWLHPPVPADIMGCFAASWEDTFSRQPFSWDAARTARRRIDKIIEGKGKGLIIDFLQAVPDYDAWHLARLGMKRTTSLDLSNIGLLKPQPEEQKWRLGAMVFSQCANVCGAAIKFSVATGGDGRMAVSYIWQEGVVEEEFVLKMAEKVQAEIEGLVAGEAA